MVTMPLSLASGTSITRRFLTIGGRPKAEQTISFLMTGSPSFAEKPASVLALRSKDGFKAHGVEQAFRPAVKPTEKSAFSRCGTGLQAAAK
jgi:hypothetical protein